MSIEATTALLKEVAARDHEVLLKCGLRALKYQKKAERLELALLEIKRIDRAACEDPSLLPEARDNPNDHFGRALDAINVIVCDALGDS